MFAALPPSSIVIFLSLPATERRMTLPTSVEPVNAILAAVGCAMIRPPVEPGPVITLTTPGGSPASWKISASLIALSGVLVAGLMTTQLPIAIAGAIFQAIISSGKFHGMTWPTTPSGATRRPGAMYSSLSAQPA